MIAQHTNLVNSVCAGNSESYVITDKTKVKRLKDRGTYDRKTVHSILDEAFIAHVGFVKDGYPLVLPMGYARDGEHLLLHGSITNAMLKGLKVCSSVQFLQVEDSMTIQLTFDAAVLWLSCFFFKEHCC